MNDLLLSERMREALAHSGLTINAFVQRMKERGVRGATKPTVASYLRRPTGPDDPPPVEPPLSFLREMCAVLPGIRLEWLVAGTGEMTHAAEIGAAFLRKAPTKKGPPFEAEHRTVSRMVIQGFTEYAGGAPLPALALETMVAVAYALSKRDGGQGEIKQIAYEVGFLFGLPFKIIGVRLSRRSVAFSVYVQATAAALLALATAFHHETRAHSPSDDELTS